MLKPFVGAYLEAHRYSLKQRNARARIVDYRRVQVARGCTVDSETHFDLRSGIWLKLGRHSDFIHLDVGRVGSGVSIACQPHCRRLSRIRITLGKSFFERSVVPVNVGVKMNDSILSYDNGTIQN